MAQTQPLDISVEVNHGSGRDVSRVWGASTFCSVRLLGALGGTVVEGFIAGLIVWGIAAGIPCATREAAD